MIAETALRHSNPNVKAQMSNEGILPILYSIGSHPPFDIWILAFDILVERIINEYVIYLWDTTLEVVSKPFLGPNLRDFVLGRGV